MVVQKREGQILGGADVRGANIWPRLVPSIKTLILNSYIMVTLSLNFSHNHNPVTPHPNTSRDGSSEGGGADVRRGQISGHGWCQASFLSSPVLAGAAAYSRRHVARRVEE